MYNTFKYFLCLLSLCANFPVTAQSSLQRNEESGNMLQNLEHSFSGAYPADTPQSEAIKEFELTASESEWPLVPPYQTAVWAYNKTVPGPEFRIKLGETIRVNFINNLPQPTTVHWHGIRVPNAMDGVPGVTQPPIEPGESFTYEFTPKDPGTFWFHPHVNTAEQMERGLHGVLVVEDPDEPQYSQDLAWVLDDWRLEKYAVIDSNFVTRHDLAHDGRWGNISTVNGKFKPEFTARPGERIRIRLVNAANGRVFSPSFEKLSPLVIAVDGMLTKQPFPLNRFFLAPGNRLDLDITIPEDATGKTLPIRDAISRDNTIIAYLKIDAANPVKTPDFPSPVAKHFPDWDDALNIPVSHEFQLDAKRGGPYGISWTIDDQAWPDATALELKKGRFTRLRFYNHSSRLHPMHLHGQFFKVIARDDQKSDENFWRDTVLIGPNESVDIAMIPLDPGIWVQHCHILEHAEAGMMSTISVR